MPPTERTTRTLRLRISCPASLARASTEFGIQDRQLSIDHGQAQADGVLSFEVGVQVVRHAADGSVRYRGPYVHGTPDAPFLYLSLRPVGGEPANWLRRIKIRFPILTSEQLDSIPETCVLATHVSGERSRTVPLHIYDWVQQVAGDV